MSLEKFLKVVGGNVILMTIHGNKVRTYYTKGNATRADFYSAKDESVIIQLSTGRCAIINKNGGIVRTI